MARSDLSIFTTYGYRDSVDKLAKDFFGEQIEDAATVAQGSQGDGLGTGVGDSGAAGVVPTTASSLEAARTGLARFGIGSDGGDIERIATAFGGAVNSPEAYAQSVAEALSASGYDPGGVGASELAGFTSGLTPEQIRAAIGGEGDQAIIDQVLAASSLAVQARGQAVSSWLDDQNRLPL